MDVDMPNCENNQPPQSPLEEAPDLVTHPPNTHASVIIDSDNADDSDSDSDNDGNQDQILRLEQETLGGSGNMPDANTERVSQMSGFFGAAPILD